MKKHLLIFPLFMFLLSCAQLAAADGPNFNLLLEQAHSAEDTTSKANLYYKAYTVAGSKLEKKFKKEDLLVVIKSFKKSFKVYKNWMIIEGLVPVYQKNKETFDSLIKENLSIDEEKEFKEKMKIALEVATGGTG